ncbi:MAG: MarR family transcriptional regulator, partial [Bacillota bacterium]|nr:MarR family transcriptional regulator [Bacillota bacterium]
MDVNAFRAGLRRLAAHMLRVEETCLVCCGVSMAGCHIIMEAGKAGQLTLSSLAAGLGLDLSSVSRGVDGLVRD